MTKRQLKLGAFMRPVSIHTGAWRYPGAWPDANFNFDHIKQLIRKLEAGKFDAFFMADHLAVLNMPIDALKRSHTVTSFEPFTLLSALSAVTERIGLIATGSTTFDEPYHVARRFASLDHISGGRAGVEHRHHVKSGRRAEFRARRPHGTRRALQAGARILRCGDGPVGLLRRRRFCQRRRGGPLFRSRQDACAQSQGQISQRARTAQHRPPGAGLACDRPGRGIR